MEVEEFWAIIETARAGARTCDDVAVQVTQRLTRSGRETAEAFTDRFNEVMDQLYSWDLWGVAYILKSGCSDDAFEYFRCWVISLGREMTERAISDPEGFGLMVDVGYENRFRVSMECEPLLYAGPSVVMSFTGEYPARKVPQPTEPSGTGWQESGLRPRFPGLMEGRPAI